jgi:hypothetical protein
MKLVIYIKHTQDWLNCSYKDLHFPHVVPHIKLWNSIYTLPYFEYRAALKEIALENWDKVSTNIVTDLNDIEDDDIIIPTDDDDWLHEDLAGLVNEDFEFIYWGCLCHNTVDGGIEDWYAHHNTLCSNNFAFRGHVLRTFSRISCDPRDHARVMQVVLAEHNDRMVDWRDRHLSCYNYHPGSASVITQRKVGFSPSRLHGFEGYWQPLMEKFYHVQDKLQVRPVFL